MNRSISYSSLRWYFLSFELSADRRKFSPRGEASQLLWLYLFIACMIVLFMCHSIVADTCATYIARKMDSTRSKETFDVIDTFRLVLMIPYTFIFASHSSMLMKRWTIFRFIDDRVLPDDEWTAKSPPLIKRSFGTILMSYVAINVYLLLLQLGLLLLQLQLDRTDSPIAPITEHRIFSFTLRSAAFFLYTSQIFDIPTNIAILMGLADMGVFSLSNSLYGVILVCITNGYRALSLSPTESVRSVTTASSESTQAINASTSQSHTALLDPSVVGEIIHCCCLSNRDQFACKLTVTQALIDVLSFLCHHSIRWERFCRPWHIKYIR